MHQGSTLFVGKLCSHLFTNGFKAGVKQFDDVKLVYYQVGMRQDLTDCIMVRSPHIGANDLDMLLHCLGQALQIANHGFFAPISQKINDAVVFHIAEHATVLVQQIQFVDPQTSDRCTRPVGRKASGVLAKQQANTCLRQSDLIGDADKGSAQCLLLDVVDQAACAKVVLVHIGQFLKEGSATATALEAAAQNGDAYALTSDGQVHVELGFDFVPVELLVFTETHAMRNEIKRVEKVACHAV